MILKEIENISPPKSFSESVKKNVKKTTNRTQDYENVRNRLAHVALSIVLFSHLCLLG